MIILDTNVVSALMRRVPEPGVVSWLDAQPAESVWTTSITLFEVQFGLAILPEGERRDALVAAFGRMVAEDLAGRILDFDVASASSAARIAAELRAAGRPVDVRDLQIAGIVAARRATLATRNVRHFADAGIAVVDPWAAAA